MSEIPGCSPEQYAQELTRTRPDFVVYRPESEFVQGENQHLIVIAAPSGRLLAFWTQSTIENHPDQKVVLAVSDDAGLTWSSPRKIDGAAPHDPLGTGLASWAFPILAPGLGRLYLFYNKKVGLQDTREDTTGVLRGRYSADEGETWSPSFDLPIAPCALSHPDPAMPQSWIVFQAPIPAADGVPIVGSAALRLSGASQSVSGQASGDVGGGPVSGGQRLQLLYASPEFAPGLRPRSKAMGAADPGDGRRDYLPHLDRGAVADLSGASGSVCAAQEAGKTAKESACADGGGHANLDTLECGATTVAKSGAIISISSRRRYGLAIS